MLIRRAGLPLSCLLAGCTTVYPTIRNVELVVYPRVVPTTQAAVQQLNLSSIATLDILPYVESSPGVFSPISATTGNPTVPEDLNLLKLTQASPSIDPSRPFVIQRLRPNKNYRIYAKAYDTSNSLISKDESSYVQVAVGNDTAPNMATLPVNLVATPFGATTSVTINADGRFDYLKTTLYLVSNAAQVAVSQTTRSNSNVDFANLQGNTNYKLVAEAYKLGGMVSSASLNINITNDNAPATSSLNLTVPYIVSTLAGGGGATSAGFANGNGTTAKFDTPVGISVDSLGNLYVVDVNNNLIRKITSSGAVSTFAGGAGGTVAGNSDNAGTAALFSHPLEIAIDGSGNLYVTDTGNEIIRKISSSGAVTTIAGGYGYADGTGMAAKFNYPIGITVDNSGNLYIVDSWNQLIRKMSSSGVVSTIAGQYGITGYADGVGTAAKFNYPHSIAVDQSGNLYVTDNNNHLIRKITSSGVVSTFAGSTAFGHLDGTGTATKFCYPAGISIDAVGNLYVADQYTRSVRKITPTAVVTTLAGSGVNGYANGTGTSAIFNIPTGAAIDALGNVYIAEYNNLIRVLR